MQKIYKRVTLHTLHRLETGLNREASVYSYMKNMWSYYGSKVSSFDQWATDKCDVLPIANAGQYTTVNCKMMLFCFSCKWQHIMSGPLTFHYQQHGE